MKNIIQKILLIVAFAMIGQYASAQWGWGGQSMYDAGRAWAQNMQAQNNAAYKSGQAYAALLKAKWDIANGNYSEAFQGLVKADEMYTELNGYGSPEAIDFLGYCYELGMGTGVNRDKALQNYKWAANRGSVDAKGNLQRINTSGWINTNSEVRTSFSNFLKNVLQGQAAMGMSNFSSNGSSSSSSNSSSSSSRSSSGPCSVCGGTGVNPTPSSTYGSASWIAHYNSSGSRCPYCNGLSQHYHTKCAHCNVPSW